MRDWTAEHTRILLEVVAENPDVTRDGQRAEFQRRAGVSEISQPYFCKKVLDAGVESECSDRVRV